MALLAFFAVLPGLVSGAMAIQAPSEVPMYSAWTAKWVAPDAKNFESMKLYLSQSGTVADETRIGEFTNNLKFIPDARNGKGIIAYNMEDEDPNSTDGLVVYVTYQGLPAGEYMLMAIALDDEIVKETVETDFAVIDPRQNAAIDATQEKVSAVAGELESLRASNKTYEERFQNLLTVTQNSYAQVQDDITRISDSLNEIETRRANLSDETRNTLDEMRADLANTQDRLDNFLQELEEEKKSNIFTGLSTLGGENAAYLGLLVLAIVAMGVLVIWMRSRMGESIFFKGGSAEGLSSWGEAEPQGKGRWATRDKKSDAGGFNLSDLLRNR